MNLATLRPHAKNKKTNMKKQTKKVDISRGVYMRGIRKC
nr:MAG TPA: hypothetical protein [Caudoviricetes sp.]